jgi:anti-sigma factor RsiW
MTAAELNCQAFVELVTEYLENALSAGERARFEYHLADCPDCSVFLEQMRRTIQVVGHLSEESISPQIKSEMLTRFRDWNRE